MVLITRQVSSQLAFHFNIIDFQDFQDGGHLGLPSEGF